MGCDIHGFLEVEWGKWCQEVPIEDGRNYALFSALADVRNERGPYRIEPISEPRGLPQDSRTKDDDPYQYHSHSWLSLDEILAWPGWDVERLDTGIVSRADFEGWDGGRYTGRSCGFITGPNVLVANALTDSFPEGWTHVRIQWPYTLRDYCWTFLKWVDYAKALAGERPARIVFWFDN